MAFPTLQYSRTQVNKAGKILISKDPTDEEKEWAENVLLNWRACHGYPINTFQSTLRKRLGAIDSQAIVAQRLKRAPSIIGKLKRFDKMQLARMQDIGGLRAIVQSLPKVKRLVDLYKHPGGFAHELISVYDYIENPKSDGYRCIHLIYRYKNKNSPHYNGLLVELQVRTKLQHAWATAVETMGIFLKQALKASQGEIKWLEYFRVVSSAFAHIEKTQLVPNYEQLDKAKTFKAVKKSEDQLKVLNMLQGFSLAADNILERPREMKNSYHLIILDYHEKITHIKPYARDQLDTASKDYAHWEARANKGEPIEVVLVSAGSIELLRKAYPNYFLDTKEFIRNVSKIIDEA